MKIKYLFVIIIAFLLILSVVHSCKDDPFNLQVNCDECHVVKPDSGDIIVRLTWNDTYDSIPVMVYKGKVEDNNIEYVDTAYGTYYYLRVKLNEYYSVRAEYKNQGKTTYVFDGGKIKTVKISDVCQQDCYIIKKGEYDLRLKE